MVVFENFENGPYDFDKTNTTSTRKVNDLEAPHLGKVSCRLVK